MWVLGTGCKSNACFEPMRHLSGPFGDRVLMGDQSVYAAINTIFVKGGGDILTSIEKL